LRNICFINFSNLTLFFFFKKIFFIIKNKEKKKDFEENREKNLNGGFVVAMTPNDDHI